MLSTHEFLDALFENGAFVVGGYIPALRDGSFPTGVSEEPVGTMGEVSVWYADKCNLVDLDDGIFKQVANIVETIDFGVLNVRSRNLHELSLDGRFAADPSETEVNSRISPGDQISSWTNE